MSHDPTLVKARLFFAKRLERGAYGMQSARSCAAQFLYGGPQSYCNAFVKRFMMSR